MHLLELGFIPIDAPVSNRIFSCCQGIIDAVVCIVRIRYLKHLIKKQGKGYFDDPHIPSSASTINYAFGSLQDLLNRALRYIYIITIIIFVHLPKLMLITVTLVVMCDPTFMNMILLCILFYKVKKGVGLYPRWADSYRLCIMPLLIQIPIVYFFYDCTI